MIRMDLTPASVSGMKDPDGSAATSYINIPGKDSQGQAMDIIVGASNYDCGTLLPHTVTGQTDHPSPSDC